MVKVNEFTKNCLRYRRFVKEREREGWERVDDSRGVLADIDRCGRYRAVILDVRIAPGGKELWVKCSEPKPKPPCMN